MSLSGSVSPAIISSRLSLPSVFCNPTPRSSCPPFVRDDYLSLPPFPSFPFLCLAQFTNGRSPMPSILVYLNWKSVRIPGLPRLLNPRRHGVCKRKINLTATIAGRGLHPLSVRFSRPDSKPGLLYLTAEPPPPPRLPSKLPSSALIPLDHDPLG